MDAELKSKWVAALRSGEYRQGESQLYNRSGDSYCCLGVLCKVAGLAVDDVDDRIGDAPLGPISDRYHPLKEIIGSDDLYQFTTRNDAGRHPSAGEDMPKHTFAQLADYIEANIPAESLAGAEGA